MLPQTIRVFVNSGAMDLPAGTVVGDAIRLYDATLGEHLATGAAYVTDGRGIELDASARLSSGSVLRVVVRARRGVDADA